MPSTETSSKSSVIMFQNLRQRASRKCNPSRMTWSRGPALIFTLGARTRVENWEFRRILPNLVCPLLYRMVMASGWVSRVIFLGSSNQLNCPRWSSHHPVAEACYSKKASTSMHSRSLCPRYILKTSSRHVTGHRARPLHYGLIEGYTKSQAGKGDEKTSDE